MMDSYTLDVLKQLERGEINIEQANARLNATPASADAPTFRPELPGWVRWLRLYPLVSGTMIVLFGAWIIVSTVHANILWLVLGLPIVLLGALFLSVGAIFYSAHWLYVNIEKTRKRPRTIRFAIPFPLGLIRVGSWFARFNPKTRAKVNVNTSSLRFDAVWDDPVGFLNALERELKEGRGIAVNLGENGKRVQVYIH